ncbi:hypothetical protein SeMB42_g04567 [Synchytrium endobioticum]|uniref:Condensation domain-containing protein n=1 Tax=Synchytrium endobioticum TaxID=286115 RepID=A0A507CXI4_9FUNG|nr:hypothetical protein SeMB42_g04567 [Synchytrium endobioticum]
MRPTGANPIKRFARKSMRQEHASTSSLHCKSTDMVNSRTSLVSLADLASRLSSTASIPSSLRAALSDVSVSGTHAPTSQRVSLAPTVSLTDLQQTRKSLDAASRQSGKKVSRTVKYVSVLEQADCLDEGVTCIHAAAPAAVETSPPLVEHQSLPPHAKDEVATIRSTTTEPQASKTVSRERKPVVYPLTPMQTEFFNLMTRDHPCLLTQVHKMPFVADMETVKTCVARLLLDHRILASQLFQNEKIIDADVEGIIPGNPTTIAVAEEVNIVDNDMPFRIFLLRNIALSAREHGVQHKQVDVILTMISHTLCDEVGLAVVVRDLMCLLRKCQAWLKDGVSNSQVYQQLVALPLKNDDYQPETAQVQDYIGAAINYKSNAEMVRRGISFCKQQLTETIQELVNPGEKKKLEAEIKRLSNQVFSYSRQKNVTAARKEHLEIEYNRLRDQRVALDDSELTSVAAVTIPASITGSPLHLTQPAWTALIQTVLGDSGARDDLEGLVAKHGLMDETRQKLGTKAMSILEFACITEGNLNPLNLLTKEKRKVLALTDYVRNRIKECLEGQTKIKFDLERQLVTLKRQLARTNDDLKKAQDDLESADDMRMRLQNVLKPPMVNIEVPIVSVDGGNQRSIDGSRSSLLGSTHVVNVSHTVLDSNVGGSRAVYDPYGVIPVHFGESTVQSIFSYAVRKRKISSADKLRKLQQDIVESDSSGEDHEGPQKQDDATHPDAVCLAAFAIMLKHVVGMEKYVVGITQNLRRKDMDAVGPCSNTLPLRLHFPQSGITFHDLVGKLIRRLRRVDTHAPHSSAPAVSRQVSNLPPFGPPVRFQYLGRDDVASLNLSESEILAFPHHMNASNSLLWANSDDQVHLKFTVVETLAGGLVGALRYRRDKGIQDDDVVRWAEKLGAVLLNVDMARQDTVATLISRFQSTVWSNFGSSELVFPL